MRIGQAFPSKYLKASDLPEGQFIGVTIDRVQVENVAGNGQAEEDKPVLYFVGKEKGLVLNRTNSQAIADVFGDETDDWTGKRILIYATETLFQGTMKPCIRVKVQKGKPAPAPSAAPKPAAPKPTPAQAEYAGEEPATAAAAQTDDIPF